MEDSRERVAESGWPGTMGGDPLKGLMWFAVERSLIENTKCVDDIEKLVK